MKMTRRTLLGGMGATAGLGVATGGILRPNAALATDNSHYYFNGTSPDSGYIYRRTEFKNIKKQWHRQMVRYTSSEPAGTVVVDTRHHHLYVIWGNNTALRYGVGVGREGFQWFGRATINRKAKWPRWVPPPEMLVRQPELPPMVEGGDPENPLGPRALYLYNNKQDTGYRLHGTTQPWTIGTDISSGCVRMLPEDIIDLYQRCPVGTEVLVLEHLASYNG